MQHASCTPFTGTRSSAPSPLDTLRCPCTMVGKVEVREGADLAWAGSGKNPLNWSRPRKWMITLTACYMSSLISIAASSYSLGVDEMVVDLQAPRLLVVSGISL